MSGSYHIGQNKTFSSINSAINALHQQGINGPVTLLLDSGVYFEQLSFHQISGTSINQSVTLKSVTGNAEDAIIRYSANNIYTNYILKFNGASHLKFENLSIIYNGTSSTGRIVDFLNVAKDIEFNGVHFKTNSLFSPSSQNEIFNKNDNSGFVQDIRIVNCILEGGNNPISISNGQNISNNLPSLELSNCEISNGHGELISLSNFKNVKILNNKLTSEHYENISTAIKCINTDQNLLIKGNYILPNKLSTGLKISGCDFSSANPGIVANNFIHRNYNSSAVIVSATHLKILHNTIHVSGSTSIANNIYINSYSSSITLKNNMLSNEAQGALINSAIPYGYLDSDYNNYFTNGNYLIASAMYGSYTSLNSWQNMSNDDLHSSTIDPQYFFPFDMHMRNPALNNTGVAISEIDDDIDGDPRSTTSPDIGADEFTAVQNDIALIDIYTENQNPCLAYENIHVKVQNRGMYPINLSNTPLNISGASVGQNPQNFNATAIMSGIIPKDSFMDIVIQQQYNMSQSGAYLFNIQASLSQDNNPANNTITNYSIHNNSINQFPHYQTFDMIGDINQTPWSAENTSSYMWKVGSGMILNNSGPLVDHTSGSSYGNYFYTENNAIVANQEAILESPCFQSQSLNKPALLFYYHMYGNGIGTLKIELLQNGQWNTIQTIQGQQQPTAISPWQKAQINLKPFGSWDKIRFKAIQGNQLNGIIALDDIVVGELPTANVSGNFKLCVNDSYTLKIENGSTAIWKKIPQNVVVSTSDSLVVSQAGNYSVQITDSWGFENTDTINIQQVQAPQLSILGSENICKNADKLITKVQLSNYSQLQWTSTGDGIFSNPQSLHPTYTPGTQDLNNSQIYIQVHANGIGTCPSVDGILTAQLINPPTANAGIDKAIDCNNSQAVGIGTSGNTNLLYQWSPSQYLSNSNTANPNAQPNKPMDYVLTVIDPVGMCMAKDSVHIGLINGPNLQHTQDTAICSGESLNLQASGGLSYLWSNNSTNNSITVSPTQSSQFWVKTFKNQCFDSASILVKVNPLPVVDLGNDTVLCTNSYITLSIDSGLQGLWNNFVHGQSLFYNTGQYAHQNLIWVEATDENNCSTTDTIYLDIQICNGLEESTASKVQIYPNPTQDKLNIELEQNHADCSVYLYNALGQLMLKQKIQKAQQMQHLSLHSFSKGLYFLVIQEKGKAIQKHKIIKE